MIGEYRMAVDRNGRLIGWDVNSSVVMFHWSGP